MFANLAASAAPLFLAALGGLVSELAGMLCISIEGFMIIGGFFGWVFAVQLSSVFWGGLLAALLAAFLGWALARFIHKTGANPFVAGLALNLGSSGICGSLSGLWFGGKGVLREASIHAPAAFAGLSPAVFMALLAAAAASLLLSRTASGRRLRASGLSAPAALEHGIHASRYREASWAFAGFFAALAGASLTWKIGAYIPGFQAGRPWIALAAVYLGFRTVWGIYAAAFVFAAADLLTVKLQAAAFLPATAFLGLPSLLALALYAFSTRIHSQHSLR
jgi:simple sugar transport system permease protein